MKYEKLILALVLACAVKFLASCGTMNVKGSLSYIDSQSGAKAGMTFDQDRNAGWYVKIPFMGREGGDGVAVVEGEIPITPEK
jgi:predicted small secreted protein